MSGPTKSPLGTRKNVKRCKPQSPGPFLTIEEFAWFFPENGPQPLSGSQGGSPWTTDPSNEEGKIEQPQNMVANTEPAQIFFFNYIECKNSQC